MNDILFQPRPETIDASALADYARRQGFSPTDYTGLHQWSVEQPEAYHAALWDRFDILGERGERVVLPAPISGRRGFSPMHGSIMPRTCCASPMIASP